MATDLSFCSVHLVNCFEHIVPSSFEIRGLGKRIHHVKLLALLTSSLLSAKRGGQRFPHLLILISEAREECLIYLILPSNPSLPDDRTPIWERQLLILHAFLNELHMASRTLDIFSNFCAYALICN